MSNAERECRASTPAERVLAIRAFYERNKASTDPKALLDILEWAARAAGDDGWQEIAPAWLRAVRAEVPLP